MTLVYDDVFSEIQEELRACLIKKQNIFLSGLPGAGKTILLKKISTMLSEENRFVFVGDVDDPKESFPNGVSYKKDEFTGTKGNVLKYLKHAPNWVLYDGIRTVGELKEVLDAKNTDHSVIASVNSGTALQAINQLVEMGSMEDSHTKEDVERLFDVVIHLSRRMSDRKVVRQAEIYYMKDLMKE